MDTEEYEIRYLPLFLNDPEQIVDYISHTLGNPDAAERLVNDVRTAIHRRSINPAAFERWRTKEKTALPYYRIYVRYYSVFYVVYDHVMEVRRVLYTPSDWETRL